MFEIVFISTFNNNERWYQTLIEWQRFWTKPEGSEEALRWNRRSQSSNYGTKTKNTLTISEGTTIVTESDNQQESGKKEAEEKRTQKKKKKTKNQPEKKLLATEKGATIRMHLNPDREY